MSWWKMKEYPIPHPETQYFNKEYLMEPFEPEWIPYTGIGSRKTPKDKQMEIIELAKELEKLHFLLRSGGADGADKAFGLGVQNSKHKKIYYPGHTSVEAWKLVVSVHPNPVAAMKYMTYLGRNPYQLLGDDLNTPSKFVVCWTPKGEAVGGSLVVIKLAEERGIPVFNLYNTSKEIVIGHAMKVIKEMFP